MADQLPDIAVQDHVVVELAPNGQPPVALRGRIGGLTDDALWLTLSDGGADPGLVSLTTGHPLRLMIQTPDRVWEAESTLVARRSRPGGQVLLLVKRPVAALPIQRRRAHRMTVPATVRLLSVTGRPDSPGEIGAVEAQVRNLSAGGVQIETNVSLNVGERAMLALALPPDVSVVAEAEVIRIEQPPGGPTSLRFVAFRFLGLTEQDENRIVHRLFEIQRQRRAV